MMFTKNDVFYAFLFKEFDKDIFLACKYKDFMPLLFERLHDVLELIVVLWMIEFEKIFHFILFFLVLKILYYMLALCGTWYYWKVFMTFAGEPTATQ